MMVKKLMVGGGAAAVLSIGVLVGGLTTGLVKAHPAHQSAAQQAQATPQPNGNTPGAAAETPDGAAEAPDSDAAGAPVTVPAGSITSDQAKQDATTYIQQTAPYSAQGLQATTVTVDDEDGTIVYSVDFTNSGNADVEVKVSTQGSVLSADAGSQSEGTDSGQDQADGPEQPGSPSAPAATPSATGAPGAVLQ